MKHRENQETVLDWSSLKRFDSQMQHEFLFKKEKQTFLGEMVKSERDLWIGWQYYTHADFQIYRSERRIGIRVAFLSGITQ